MAPEGVRRDKLALKKKNNRGAAKTSVTSSIRMGMLSFSPPLRTRLPHPSTDGFMTRKPQGCPRTALRLDFQWRRG